MRFSTMIATAATLLAGSIVMQPAPLTAVGASPTMIRFPAATTVSTMVSSQQAQVQTPKGDVKVDVTTDHTRTVWYTQPIWLGSGAVVVLLVVLVLVLAGRGGRDGTTVIKS